MSQVIITNAGQAALAGAGFPGLATPRIDLITALAGTPGPATVWGDLTIAAFTGYAGPVTVTVSAEYVSRRTGLPSTDISDANFIGPTAGAGVDVIGAVFHDTTATPVVYAVFLFDGPVPLQLPSDRVVVDETINLQAGGVFGLSN